MTDDNYQDHEGPLTTTCEEDRIKCGEEMYPEIIHAQLQPTEIESYHVLRVSDLLTAQVQEQEEHHPEGRHGFRVLDNKDADAHLAHEEEPMVSPHLKTLAAIRNHHDHLRHIRNPKALQDQAAQPDLNQVRLHPVREADRCRSTGPKKTPEKCLENG